MVLGDDNAHGTSMVTTVGPPRGLDNAIVPSNAARRRSMPRRPVPVTGSAPPMPSSVTTMVNTPSAWCRDTDPVRALLCRIILVSVSATAKYAADSTRRSHGAVHSPTARMAAPGGKQSSASLNESSDQTAPYPYQPVASQIHNGVNVRPTRPYSGTTTPMIPSVHPTIAPGTSQAR